MLGEAVQNLQFWLQLNDENWRHIERVERIFAKSLDSHVSKCMKFGHFASNYQNTSLSALRQQLPVCNSRSGGEIGCFELSCVSKLTFDKARIQRNFLKNSKSLFNKVFDKCEDRAERFLRFFQRRLLEKFVRVRRLLKIVGIESTTQCSKTASNLIFSLSLRISEKKSSARREIFAWNNKYKQVASRLMIFYVSLSNKKNYYSTKCLCLLDCSVRSTTIWKNASSASLKKYDCQKVLITQKKISTENCWKSSLHEQSIGI